MRSEDRDALRHQLIDHEGLRLTVYTDSLGILTIGVGRNLEGRGITEDEAFYLLNNDIDLCVRGLAGAYPWFAVCDPLRQRALVDLAFNLGLAGLAAFKKFLAAMARTDYDTAAHELETSLWFRQVGRRGSRIVSMIRGVDPSLPPSTKAA